MIVSGMSPPAPCEIVVIAFAVFVAPAGQFESFLPGLGIASGYNPLGPGHIVGMKKDAEHPWIVAEHMVGGPAYEDSRAAQGLSLIQLSEPTRLRRI